MSLTAMPMWAMRAPEWGELGKGVMAVLPTS